MKTTHPPDTCLWCGQARFRLLFRAGKYTIQKCVHCGLVQTIPRVVPDAPDELYDATYFEGLEQHRELEEEHQTNFLAAIEQHIRSGELLEIGIGIGIFMHLAHRRGWCVQGVEPSQAACQYVAQTLDRPIRNATLHEAGFHDQQFDVVALRHVLEHIAAPHPFLEEIHRILKDDGVAALVVPNFGSLHARVERADWFYLSLPYHLAHYTPRTLRRVLDAAQFEVLELCTVDNSSSSYLIGLLNRLRRMLRQTPLNIYLKPEKLDPHKDLAHWIIAKEALFNRLMARFGLGDEIRVLLKKR